MRSYGFFFVATATIALSPLFACTVEPAPGCATDDDCRNGRVCFEGSCSFAGGALGGGGATGGGGLGGGGGTGTGGGGGTTTPVDGVVIRLEPRRLDFGEVEPGTNQTRFVEVHNDGTDTLVITGVTVRGALFSVPDMTDRTVAPGADPALLEVTLSLPSRWDGTDSISGHLTVESNASNPSAGVDMTARAGVTVGEHCFDIEVETPFVPAGELSELGLILFNCGNAALVTGLAVSDPTGRFGTPDAFPLELWLEPGEGGFVSVLVEAPDDPGGSDLEARLSFLADSGEEAEWFDTVRVEAVDGGDDCGPGVSVETTPDGESSEGGLHTTIGNQVSLFVEGRRARLGEVFATTLPVGSLGLVGRRTEREAYLVPDVPGVYRVMVETTYGECIAQHEVTVEVELPDDQLVAWTVWPEDALPRVSDFDLYLALQWDGGYQWEEPGLSVGPPHQYADFGEEGRADDDGALNVDVNSTGLGPERITIREMSPSERYAIGPHLFRSATGEGGEVRLQIALGGDIVFDGTQRLSDGQFWIAAEVSAGELVETHEVITAGFPESTLP